MSNNDLGLDSIDLTKDAKLDENAGKITVKVGTEEEKMYKGTFFVNISLADSKKETVRVIAAEMITI